MFDIKESRLCSFIVIIMIYAISTFGGIMSFISIPGEYWLKLLAADVIATIITFVFSMVLDNASVYDPYWSVQPIIIMSCCLIVCDMNILGILLFMAVAYWGVRLTANWTITFENLNYQDWRYVMLKEKTGKFYPVINLLGIHLVPTLVVYFCILPAVVAVVEGFEFNWLCLIFIALSFGSATLQLFADVQMHKYRQNKTEPFNTNGLWRYSRHPNYLGEILMWWGVAGAVISADPSFWFLGFGAVLNTLLFHCISIPMAENRQSRKEGFETYKAATHRLWILPVHNKTNSECESK